MKQTLSVLPANTFVPPSLPCTVETLPHGLWHVLETPVDPAFGLRPGQVTTCVGDASVRIPLHPYRVRQDPAAALGFAVQLGAFLAAVVSRPRHLHLVLGLPLEKYDDGGELYFRLWVGAAVTP